MLPEHTLKLYHNEAMSSMDLTKNVADKINELIDTYNQFANDDTIWKQEQDGRVHKAILYMKDNLLNSLHDLMVQLRDSGFIDDRILYHFATIKNDVLVLDERLENLLGKVKEGSTTLDAELIDMRTDINGRVYNSAGESMREQLTTLPIGKRAIEQGHSLDMNTYTDAGNYVFTIYEGLENAPDLGGSKPRYLQIECYGTKIPDLGNIQTWGRQLFYTEDGEKVFKRYFKWDYNLAAFTFGEWRNENHNNNFKVVTSGDMNNLVEVDNYIIATPELPNMPYYGRGGLLKVHNYSYGWLVQELYGLPDFREHWYRIGNNTNLSIHTNNAEGLSVNWSKWEKVVTEDTIKNALGSVDTTFSNKGYTIVNMGDSLFGNVQDDTSISSFLGNSTGATIYNCGFGGGRMSTHYTPWDAFSMHNLANSIATGDYTNQDTYATHSEVPEYFVESVNRLKNIDFSKVDILTINYGINDFTAGKTIDDSGNSYNVDTYAGALRHSIEKLLKAYPNMRIVLITPCWSYWKENGSYSYDSDTHSVSGNLLHSFVEKCQEIAQDYHLPVVNPYDDLGVNKFNCATFSEDGIHPTEAGRKAIAKLLANVIRGM